MKLLLQLLCISCLMFTLNTTDSAQAASISEILSGATSNTEPERESVDVSGIAGSALSSVLGKDTPSDNASSNASSSESSNSYSGGIPQRIGVAGLEKILEENKGKAVFVNFFATWCPPCKKEIPSLVSVARQRGDEVVIIGLSVDQKPELLPDFLKQYGIKYQVYVADNELRQLFKVRVIPHNAMFDKDGEVLSNTAGLISEGELNAAIDKALGK